MLHISIWGAWSFVLGAKLLFGAAVLICALLTPPSTTPCELYWMPASYTSGQPSNPRRYPTCWASSQRSHIISRTPCHGAWTPAPLSADPSIGCSCTAPQIETPICTRRTKTHQFFWQQQHTCGAVGGSSMERGMGGQPHKTPHFNSRHRYTHPRNDPPKNSLTLIWTKPSFSVITNNRMSVGQQLAIRIR